MLKALFSNRLFIGALAFFVLIIVGGTLYLRHIERQDQIALERTQERLKQWQARQKQSEKAPIAETEKLPEGDTLQGGHFHEDGTWHAEPHAPVAESPPVKTETLVDVATPTRTGPLTYHADLLASNPVEALRAQAAERGHWSEKWIPNFPPDDTEAATLARNLYLTIYYPSIGDTTHPEYLKAQEYTMRWNWRSTEELEALADRREAMHYEEVFANSAAYQQYRAEWARALELTKIRWAIVSEKYAYALTAK